jgi:hypothetical protein
MEYFKNQKKFMKKTFIFNKYVLKSGILDLIGFFLFLGIVLLISSSMQQYAETTELYQGEFQQIMQDNTLAESYKSTLAENYLSSLQTLIILIVGGIIGLIVLNYAFCNFIKPIQYKMFYKKLFKKKNYWKKIGRIFRNTLPLFLGFWILAATCFYFIRISAFFFILLLFLFIIYLFAMPILRLITLRKDSFKQSWKLLGKTLLHSVHYFVFIVLFVLLWLVLSGVVTWLNLISGVGFWQYIFALIQLVMMVLVYVFLRRYLFISTKYVEKLSYHKK